MRPLLILTVTAFCSRALAGQSGSDPLDHTKWRLISTEKAGDLRLGSPPATVLFEEGRYNISGCNTMNGKYSFDGIKLNANDGISTQKACLPEAQAIDEALLKAITINHSIEIAAGRLTIMDEDGSSFVFSPVPIPSKNAATKFIYVASETRDCIGGAAPAKCLQIRETPDQPWSNYHGRIIGFHAVPGIEYRLRIKEDTAKTPPADGSGKIWFLDMVVEQKVIDRAAADAYFAAQKKK